MNDTQFIEICPKTTYPYCYKCSPASTFPTDRDLICRETIVDLAQELIFAVRHGS